MQSAQFKVEKKLLVKRRGELLGKTTKSQAKALKIVRNIAVDIFNYKVFSERILMPYILDIVIQEVKAGIELDGSVHNDSDGYDNRRDDLLWSQYKMKVYRFKNEDVFTPAFTQAIWDICIRGVDDYIVKIAYEAQRSGITINAKHFMPIPSLIKKYTAE
ncbi:MAG TPA: DUF559 domain-containing protein [Desulfobacterales bacterium]|nr:DUF559 domain-containing protein [Desulfobacterales bacterium]